MKAQASKRRRRLGHPLGSHLRPGDKKAAARIAQRKRARLQAIEDRLDLAAAKKALKEPGRRIPWAEVKGDLNL